MYDILYFSEMPYKCLAPFAVAEQSQTAPAGSGLPAGAAKTGGPAWAGR